MTRSNGTHFEDLASNEFHTFVGTQDTGIVHPVTIVDGEKPLPDFS
jgi:hypothetical protein